MMLLTKFDVGDFVRVGPHDGFITSIRVSQRVVYTVQYFLSSGEAMSYDALDFELTLLEPAKTCQENGT